MGLIITTQKDSHTLSPAITARSEPLRIYSVLVAAMIAVGAFLRFYQLGAPSFWLDEALSVAYAQLPWSQFVHLMQTRELNMLPYYLLLRAWIHLGTSEWMVRSLSALCSIATLPIFYLLGSRLFNIRVGRIGLVLLALHPWHIRFAQEARGYSLMMLLVAASTLLLVRAMDSPTRATARTWAGYAATSALAAYAHFYASLALLAQWASLALARPRGASWKAFGIAVVVVCTMLLPLLAFVVLGHADPATWIPAANVPRVGFLLFSLLVGGGGSDRVERMCELLPYVVALGAAVIAVREAWRANARDHNAWHHALVVSGATFPIVLVLLVSIVKPIFVDKYLIECLPFVVLLLAIGTQRLRPRWLSLGTLVVTLAISIFVLAGYYRGPSNKDDWRAASRYIFASAHPGDAALSYPEFASAPFDYYRAQLAANAQGAPAAPPRELGGGALHDALAHAPRSYARLWAVFNQDGDSGRVVRDSLAGRYPVLSDSAFTGVRVVLFDMR